MIPRYSVKKPYTVLVGIVIVLILGYVAFTRMTTDLLPSMELPYAIVMTTYPGASPETIETSVTSPIESSMATLDNIENITSVSNENYSLVILEFSDSANMDTLTIDMREKLDQLKSSFDDSVGSPIIMKLNPDMMPVMVAAISSDKYDSKELTDFVDDKIIPNLESIEGVASVSTTGDVKEDIQVIIRQEKIDKLNKKIKKALNKKFADAKDEIDDAKKELEDGKKELESGKEEAANQMASAEQKINDSKDQLLTSEADLKSKLAQVESGLTTIAQKEAELKASEKQLKAVPNQLKQVKEGLKQIEDAEDLLYQAKEGLTALETQKQILTTLKEAIDTGKDVVGDVDLSDLSDEELQQLATLMGMSVEQLKALIQTGQNATDTSDTDLSATLEEAIKTVDGQIKAIQTQLKAAGIDNATSTAVDKKLNELSAQKVNLENSKKQLESASSSSSLKQIEAGKKQLASSKKQLETAKAKLTTAMEQISSGKVSLNQALSELNKQRLSATIEMASANAQISSGEKQLESAEDTLDKQKDSAYESADADKTVTISMIENILKAQNFSMPAGYITEDGTSYLVRVGDDFESTDNIKDLVLMDMNLDGLEPIKLSDVADVVVNSNKDDVYAKVNGNAGIMLTMQKQTGYSTGDVSDKILARFEELKSQYEGTDFITLMDQGVYIDMVVDSVLSNLLIGALLAVIILLIFLKDLRPTIVVALSIPISILTAIVLMYFSNVTLNVISLSGLALGVGMLVDNSIVVIENIYRLRSLGYSAREAAIEGAKSVAGAISASTLTTVCVFAPIVFTEGITRQLFVDMGLTIAYSLVASLIIALTLVPAMGSAILKKQPKEHRQPLLDFLQEGYGRLIPVVLKLKPVILLGSLVLLVASIYLAGTRGTALIPSMGSTQLTLNITTDKEATMEETSKIADEAMNRIRKIDGVEDVGAMTSSSSMQMLTSQSSTDTNKVTFYILTDENSEKTNDEFGKEIEKAVKDLDCTYALSTSSMDMSALSGTGITVQIKGRDLDKLQTIAKDIQKMVKEVEGTKKVETSIGDATKEIRISVDKAKAIEYQLTTAQIFQAVNAKLSDASSSTTLSTDTYDYDVLVLKDTDEELTRKTLKNITITGKDSDGKDKEIKLKDLVTFEEAEGLKSISRNAQSRYLNVTASIADGYNIGLVSNQVNKRLESYSMPAGYSYEMTGEDESINDAMQQIMLMLVLALAFMYLIMVAQFQSLLSPFIIMFTIPLAFTGGFAALFLTGNEISIIAMIGFVMLAGIIVNNGIVLVDYINQLRREGMSKKEAIKEAGITRLRPVIMTASTTILGLSAMVFSTDMGAEMTKPMAIVTIGGLLYGTLLTLFVVPCIYDLFNREKDMTEHE